jgi:hypothetical protein
MISMIVLLCSKRMWNAYSACFNKMSKVYEDERTIRRSSCRETNDSRTYMKVFSNGI